MKSLNALFSFLPFNGYKTFLGYLIQHLAVVAPPHHQALVQAIGQILFAIGLAHKGVKENL